MQFGVTVPHFGPLASADFVAEFATTADDAGLGAVWTVDHLAMVHRVESPYLLGLEPAMLPERNMSEVLSPNYEMMTTLSFLAACTTRIRLGTSVSVLPLRNPVLNARQLATLDVYSGGRVIYGAGAGWLREEADAMSMPWDRRGRRAEEHVALLRALWYAQGDTVVFDGEFNRLPPMDPEPRPLQRPLPILIGGHSDVALERAGRIGDGWIASVMSVARAEACIAKVRASAQRCGRDPDTLIVATGTSVDVEQPGALDRLAEYAEIGVTYLNVNVWRSSKEATLDALRRFADATSATFG